MKPGFIYFDLDNTLLDHSSAEAEAHHSIYQIFPEIQAVSLKEWLKTYKLINYGLWIQYQKGEVDRYQLHRTRFRQSMLDLGIPEERSEDIGTRYMEEYRKHWKWIDGARDALGKIAKNYPVGFITNGFLETQQKKIEFLGLTEFSDTFIISEEVGVMKPHKKVFDVATKKSNTSRNSIVYVGDSYSSDIIGGRNAGWKTAWYTAFQTEIEIDQTADFIFDQFPNLVSHLS